MVRLGGRGTPKVNEVDGTQPWVLGFRQDQ